MAQSLTNQAREALALANDEARSLGHDYVGTEHILLALVRDPSGIASKTLGTLGITPQSVRAEVERLVNRGPNPTSTSALPLTPRAMRAIDDATLEAAVVNEKCAGPEHLLLGLLSEGEGVACQVLINLGVTPDNLRKEVFRVRLALMKVVERAVRPLHAGTPTKRKMREELLSHLSAIYQEEFARLGDCSAAIRSAASRFGDPTALSSELQASLPAHERLSYLAERWFAWRAPESVAQYALRQSFNTLCILVTVLVVVFAGVWLRYGWFDNIWTFIRTLAAIAVITPPAQFVLTIAMIKMRDSLWGVFGSRKSIARSIYYDAIITLVIAVSLVALAIAVRGSVDLENEPLKFAIIAGLIASVLFPLLIRLTGSNSIRDTQWALLDIESAL
jgi:Clp amino terminal domain, pathogenicity island component